MADRKAKKPGASEDPQEIVELDKDDRWQARLEEARARREIALREKAAAPKKKHRRKPWEAEPGDDPDDFEISPIIQDKPADEKDLDLADRLEAAREAKAAKIEIVKRSAPPPEPTPEPEVVPEPEPAPEPPAPAPFSRNLPKFKSKARQSFDEIIPPENTATVAPAPLPKRKPRRENKLIAPGAPDVIDLAQRYASTLKPPVNVTQPFDTVSPEPVVSQPQPEPVVMPVRHARTRRPFGLGLTVLVFSMIPLAQTAPPLEKGPPEPPSPFFALPPALGLTTSMVWPVERTSSTDWVAPPPPAALGALPGFDRSPLAGQSAALGLGPVLGGAPPVGDQGAVALTESEAPQPVPQAAPLAILPDPDAPAQPLAVPSPRPRPTAPALNIEEAPEGGSEANIGSGTVVERSVRPAGPALSDVSAPDARPRIADAAPVTPAARPLKVTILVPGSADRSTAESIAAATEARGHEIARIREVNVSISQPNVRYFFDEDRAEAERLARAYGAEVKDFTWFRPAPERGTTEIWLSGSGAQAPSRPAPQVRTVEDTPQAPPRTITVIRKQPTFLERLLTGAEDEIEIIIPNPEAILNNAQSAGADQN